jgi:hypothetical protein
MAGPHRLLLIAACTCACAGCISPRTTRLPSFWPSAPYAESQSYQRRDPFPDQDLGPTLFSRPRGYEEPRAEARRAAELRQFGRMDVDAVPAAPPLPQSTRAYPESVEQ